jgi:hypothetical protein
MRIVDFFLKYTRELVGIRAGAQSLTCWSRSRSKIDRLRNADFFGHLALHHSCLSLFSVIFSCTCYKHASLVILLCCTPFVILAYPLLNYLSCSLVMQLQLYHYHAVLSPPRLLSCCPVVDNLLCQISRCTTCYHLVWIVQNLFSLISCCTVQCSTVIVQYSTLCFYLSTYLGPAPTPGMQIRIKGFKKPLNFS